MKNRKCNHCGEPFHYCVSCDCHGGWEDDYCTHKCWLESESRKSLFKDARKVVRSLDTLAKDALRRLLGIPEKSVGILVNVLDATYIPPEGYDPEFGDEKLCKCEHPYYRHFDTYDCMSPVGCKYCPCETFEEKVEKKEPVKRILKRRNET